MNVKDTTVVLIEYQNDFISEGGKLYDAVKPILQNNNVIEQTNSLIKGAREQGAMIVHILLSFSNDYRELGDTPYGILKIVKDSSAFQNGSWGAEMSPVIDAQKNDVIIDGKCTINAFDSTNLEFVLRNNDISIIVLAGQLTNLCIESTMRSAYDKGFEVYTITDCMATLGKEQQRSAIEYSFPMFSIPLTHDEFLKKLDEN